MEAIGHKSQGQLQQECRAPHDVKNAKNNLQSNEFGVAGPAAIKVCTSEVSDRQFGANLAPCGLAGIESNINIPVSTHMETPPKIYLFDVFVILKAFVRLRG